MDRNDDGRMGLTEEAQRWYFTLLRDPSEAERAEFIEWTRRSTRHVWAFLKVRAIERELPGLNAAARQIDLQPLLAQVLEEQRSPVWPARGVNHEGRWWRVVTVTTIIVALVTTIVLFRMPSASSSLSYTTMIGERRVLPLADGSTLEMNTETAVKLHFTATGREVTLLTGEAFFNVVHDPVRPFSVRVGPISVQDLGTTFSVRTNSHETVISVFEGTVRLRGSLPLKMAPGASMESARTFSGMDVTRASSATARLVLRGKISSVEVQITALSAHELDRRMAWTRGELVIEPPEPLGEIVQELNRYHRRQLVLGDPTLATVRLGGVFDTSRADYVRHIVNLLSDEIALDVDESDPSVIRLVRRPPKE